MEHGKGLKPLARQGVAHIDLCDCGMIYFGVGPVTVKLSRDAFDQLARGVVAAERALTQPESPPALPASATNVVAFTPRPIVT
jgi:hypothetical protein